MGTLAERLLSQGREEVREEVREEARVEVLLKLLALRFGAVAPAHRAMTEAATAEARDRYIERVLTAATIAAVLA